jgi:hypothetical protein
MSYIILSGPWCHIIVLNVHAPTEDKTDDVKDNFCEELERVFDKFPKNHMKMGARGHVVVMALCYKPEGCGLYTR